MENKTGRGRRYDLRPIDGFLSREVALETAALVELSERVADQIEDLPPDGLDYAAPGTTLSIGRLALHMAGAEAGWLRSASGQEIPAALTELFSGAALDRFSEPPPPSPPAADIVVAYRSLREDYSVPILRNVKDPAAELIVRGRAANYRGLLSHLLWHWTYHSGHIGLLRLLWGSDYTWTLDGSFLLGGEDP